jgi:hypothetical protein
VLDGVSQLTLTLVKYFILLLLVRDVVAHICKFATGRFGSAAAIR